MLNDIGMISDEAIIRAFGERLRIARLKKGMTQEELGESIGIDKSRISDYEKGNRRCSITTAYRLAKAVDSSLGFLFDGKESGEMKRYQDFSEKEKIVSILTFIGYAVIDWEFSAINDDIFADYSTMHAVGLTEESFGEALRKFEDIKRAAGNSGSKNFEKSILAAAEECASQLLASNTYQESISKQS